MSRGILRFGDRPLFWWMLVSVGLVFIAASVAGGETPGKYTDVVTVPCDRFEGWVVLDPGGIGKSVKLSVVDDAEKKAKVLQIEGPRQPGSISMAANMAQMVDFGTMSFDAWSEKNTALAVGVQDADKAAFHAIVLMEGGKWKTISLTPADFAINDDSAVKKPALDPLKLRSGFVIADIGALMGKDGDNSLRIADLKIESAPLKVIDLPASLGGNTIEVRERSLLRGNTLITKGGAIKVSAPRVILDGNISMSGGSFSLENTVCTMKARFAHERRLSAEEGSTIRFRNTSFSSPLQMALHLGKGSRLEVDGADCTGAGFTAGVDAESTTDLRGGQTARRVHCASRRSLQGQGFKREPHLVHAHQFEETGSQAARR